VAAQELNINVTAATVAKQSKNFFILLLKSWVNKLVKEIPKDLVGRV
jgi:hypothetical protein